MSSITDDIKVEPEKGTFYKERGRDFPENLVFLVLPTAAVAAGLKLR